MYYICIIDDSMYYVLRYDINVFMYVTITNVILCIYVLLVLLL